MLRCSRRRLCQQYVSSNAAFGWWWADPLGVLAMLPGILWRAWETLEEAREHNDEEATKMDH